MEIRSFVDRYSLGAAVYTVVAGLSALTEWLTFFILQKYVDPFIAAIIAFFIATFANYTLSREVAFRSNRPRRDEIILVFAFSGVAFLINLSVFASLFLLTTTGPMTAKIVGTISAFVINYTCRQFFIFSSVSRFPKVSELRAGSSPSNYRGQRILEAMRSAPCYADAIYGLIRSACRGMDQPLLDFGAGDGVFVEKFLKDGISVDCVEPDSTNQSCLRMLGQAVYPDIKTLPGERYDFVYSVNVLEHLEQLDDHLDELHRVMQPEGTLFVFVPAFNFLWTSLDTEVEHVQRFTRRTLTAALTAAGFEVQSMRYFDSVGFVAALTVRLLEKFNLFRYSPKSVSFYDRVVLPFSLFFDCFLSSIVGKNLVAVVKRPTRRSATS